MVVPYLCRQDVLDPRSWCVKFGKYFSTISIDREFAFVCVDAPAVRWCLGAWTPLNLTFRLLTAKFSTNVHIAQWPSNQLPVPRVISPPSIPASVLLRPSMSLFEFRITVEYIAEVKIKVSAINIWAYYYIINKSQQSAFKANNRHGIYLLLHLAKLNLLPVSFGLTDIFPDHFDL